jgi:hypothetical protein
MSLQLGTQIGAVLFSCDHRYCIRRTQTLGQIERRCAARIYQIEQTVICHLDITFLGTTHLIKPSCSTSACLSITLVCVLS